jgi:hypothetical protein
MHRILNVFGGILCLIVLCAAFLGYFVTDTQGYDGLGRPLSSAPIFMRIMFGQERAWAGWFWFVADLFWFWGGLAIGLVLLSAKQKAPK